MQPQKPRGAAGPIRHARFPLLAVGHARIGSMHRLRRPRVACTLAFTHPSVIAGRPLLPPLGDAPSDG